MIGTYKHQHTDKIKQKRTNGWASPAFTIVELLIIIATIGILTTIAFVAYGSWQARTASNVAKSDLTQVASAMQSDKNFSDGYKVLTPGAVFDGGAATKDLFTSSPDILLTYVSGDKTTYCIQAQSKSITSVVYHYNPTTGSDPVEGTCDGGEAPDGDGDTLAAPTVTATAASESSINVSWNSVSGAIGYVLKYGTASPTATSSCTTSPCTITGLTASTLYRISVTANGTGGVTSEGTAQATTSSPAVPSSIADDFNRTSATLGNTSVGNLPWQALTGTWKTNGTQAALSVNSPSTSPVAVVDAATANVDIKVDLNPDDALYFRVKDSTNWWRVREQTNTQSSTYYTTEPYTYYTYSYTPSSWAYAGSFCETADYYPATGTFYSYPQNGYDTLMSVHNGVGSGGCSSGKTNDYGCGDNPCTHGFQIQDYTRTINQTSVANTGYQSVAHTTYTTYYGLVLEKMVGGTVSQVWAQGDSTSQPSLARVVANGNTISVYNTTSGSSLTTVSDSFNATETKHGIGRAVTTKSGSGIDNFSLTHS